MLALMLFERSMRELLTAPRMVQSEIGTKLHRLDDSAFLATVFACMYGFALIARVCIHKWGTGGWSCLRGLASVLVLELLFIGASAPLHKPGKIPFNRLSPQSSELYIRLYSPT
jgi:hypothetical protein